jgi:hypothetical protein
MSHYQDVYLPDGIIRNFLHTVVNAGNFAFDVPAEGQAVGLDLMLHNNGAAVITIAVNGQPAINVNPGAVYTLNGVNFWLVAVVAAVNYELQIAGVSLSLLRRRGLLK